MSQRKLILSMQMTVDGYVAGPHGEADWLLTGDDDWTDLFKDIEASDTYLLGRIMYPDYAAHWQSVLKNAEEGNELKFAKLAEKTQHIVFTKGDFKPDWKNTRVSNDVKGEMANLKKQPGRNIIAWGGANFASSLMNLGVLDEIRIALNPTILSDGKAMFGDVDHRSRLQLIDSSPLKSGLTILRYRV